MKVKGCTGGPANLNFFLILPVTVLPVCEWSVRMKIHKALFGMPLRMCSVSCSLCLLLRQTSQNLRLKNRIGDRRNTHSRSPHRLSGEERTQRPCHVEGSLLHLDPVPLPIVGAPRIKGSVARVLAADATTRRLVRKD